MKQLFEKFKSLPIYKLPLGFLLVVAVLSALGATTNAIYLHHERSTLANLESDLQNREIGLDITNKTAVGKFSDGTKFHLVSQEEPNIALTGSLSVTGAASFSNTITNGFLTANRLLALNGSSQYIANPSLTANGFIYPTAAGAVASTAAAGNGQLLIGSTSAAPVLGTPTGTTNQITVATGAGTLGFSIPNSFTLPSASPAFTSIGAGVTPVYGLDVETLVGITAAKFGATTPLYLGAPDPIIGFNAYYNSGWKYGKASVAKYGADLDFSPTSGLLTWDVSSATGNADAAATMGTKFSITKDGNTSVAGTLGVTGATTTAGITVNGLSTVIGANFGVGQSAPASLNSRSTVIEVSAANDASVKLPGIILRGNGTSYSTNPAWEMFLSNPSGTTTGFNISSGTTNYFSIGNTGVVNLSNLTASSAVATDASKNLISVTNTGTGNNVLATSPTLVTPALGAATATTIALGGNEAFDYDEGTFTATATGFTAGVTGTARYVRFGKAVTLFIPAMAGTSNTTALTITGLPAAIAPARGMNAPVHDIEDNSAIYSGNALVNSTTITFSIKTAINTGETTTFTASGAKGIFVDMVITYNLI